MQEYRNFIVSGEEAEKLAAAGNPEAALLLIYARSTGDLTLSKAADVLRMNEDTVQWGHILLRKLGFLEETGSRSPAYDRERAPVYSSEMLKTYIREHGEFPVLQKEVERRLGRLLSTDEMKTLLTFRDYLNMPPEVVSMAVTYCIQNNDSYNAAKGKNRRMTMRMIERECYKWANDGIMTLEDASRYIMEEQNSRQPVAVIQKRMGLDGRKLADTERKYIEAWLKMGFGVDAIMEAYDSTVTNTGKLAWKYMDKILLNWNEKNLHTLQEIRNGDCKPIRERESSPVRGEFVPGDQERAAVQRMREMFDQMKEQ